MLIPIKWSKQETPEGFVYSTEDVDGYVILQYAGDEGPCVDAETFGIRPYAKQADTFFVGCIGADREYIGPLDTFKAAEDVIIKIGICLVQYEEQLWCVMAARAGTPSPQIYDGTACTIEETMQ